MGMSHLPIIVPQSEIVTSANTGANQLVVHIKLTRPTRHFSGFLLRLSATISGTAPGTARGISQLFHDITAVNEKGVVVFQTDGQALSVCALDSIAFNNADVQPGYQWWVDNVTAATGVAAVGVWAVLCDFPGTYLTVTVNLNAATATGYTAVTTCAYALSAASIESHGEANPHLLKGEYITNTAKYIGTYSSRYATIAADNAELSTIITSLKVGGADFTAIQSAIAEEAFNASIPPGLLPSGYGTAFAGQATKPPVNTQTGNNLGIARIGGTVAAPLQITFNTSPTFFVVQRIPLAS